MDANKVLSRYAAGERNFRAAHLRAISLTKANLRDVDLTGADTNSANAFKFRTAFM